MENNKKEISLIKHKAEKLSFKFPDNPNLTDKEKEATRNAIIKGGIVTSDNKAFLDKNVIPKLLITDKKGVNKVYNDLDDDEKFEDGNTKYVDTSAINKELSKRIQEPRPQLEREKLKDSRDCINAFIDCPILEKERSIESDRIRDGLPKLTVKKVKAEGITCDQLTGEDFDNDAEGHHKERKSDNPRKALDLDNIIVVKKETHKEIHKNDAENPESLLNLAQEKKWNTEHI